MSDDLTVNFYRLKNMRRPEYNGRVVQTVYPQELDYMEPISEAEYKAGRAKERADV